MSKDNLSWDDLEVICSSLPPKGVIGIVCRPDCVEAIRKVASLYEKPDPFNPPSLFCGVPIYDKVGQIEAWRAFYDEVELREYLKEPIDLWLDDLRDPAKHGCIGWTWVKTAQEAIDLLATGRVRKASLDHDLTTEQTLGQPSTEPTGYTVVCWMEEHQTWPPEGVKVHSQNPVGRARMEQVIRRAYQ